MGSRGHRFPGGQQIEVVGFAVPPQTDSVNVTVVDVVTREVVAVDTVVRVVAVAVAVVV